MLWTTLRGTSGPAACGSCRLRAEEQEAVIAVRVWEQEEQGRGGRFGCHAAVAVLPRVTNPARHPGDNAY